MKHIKLFENFEVAEPIRFGDSLNQKELTILEKYNIPCPELIKKDDSIKTTIGGKLITR